MSRTPTRKSQPQQHVRTTTPIFILRQSYRLAVEVIVTCLQMSEQVYQFYSTAVHCESSTLPIYIIAKRASDVKTQTRLSNKPELRKIKSFLHIEQNDEGKTLL